MDICNQITEPERNQTKLDQEMYLMLWEHGGYIVLEAERGSVTVWGVPA